MSWTCLGCFGVSLSCCGLNEHYDPPLRSYTFCPCARSSIGPTYRCRRGGNAVLSLISSGIDMPPPRHATSTSHHDMIARPYLLYHP